MSDHPASELVHVPAEPPHEPPKRRLSAKAHRRLLVAGAAFLAVAAIAGGGVALGWWFATSVVVAGQQNPESEIVHVPVGSALGGGTVMPDVRGLSPETAMSVLADAGVQVSLVTIDTRPAAGARDLVIEQTPVFGSVAPSEVVLIVSAPASVPDVTGLSSDDATNQLIELGARVEQNEVYVPDAELGVVRAVDPAAGSALPEKVTITVTAEPSSVFLSQLERSGSCSRASPLLMNGVTYDNGMTCQSTASGRETSWQLSKAVDVLSGTIGVPDSTDPGSTARVQVLGDGVQLAQFDVAYGASQPVELRVSGVLRLTIITTTTSGSGVDVGFGDFAALGGSAPIAALARR